MSNPNNKQAGSQGSIHYWLLVGLWLILFVAMIIKAMGAILDLRIASAEMKRLTNSLEQSFGQMKKSANRLNGAVDLVKDEVTQ